MMELHDHMIWDNSNIAENYPGHTLPLTISFVSSTYAAGYAGLALSLGIPADAIKENKKWFEQIVGSVNGSIYYNISAWLQIFRIMPFSNRMSSMFLKTYISDPVQIPEAKFKNPFLYIKCTWKAIALLAGIKKVKRDFEANMAIQFDQAAQFFKKPFTEEELDQFYLRMERDLMQEWKAPIVSLYALFYYQLLKTTCRKWQVNILTPNIHNELIQPEHETISSRLVKSLHLLKRQMLEHGLHEAFASDLPDDDILKKIYNKPELKAGFEQYIEAYGERCLGGELKLENHTYKDDPLLLVYTLRQFTVAGSHMVPQESNHKKQHELIQEMPIAQWKKRIISHLARKTSDFTAARENYRFYRARAFGIARRIFREKGHFMQQDGHIDNAADIFYLYVEEIFSQVNKPLQDVVKQRKKAYDMYDKLPIVQRYHQFGNDFQAVEKKPALAASRIIKGIACSKGIVTGKVRKVNNPDNIHDMENHILVAEYTDPAWAKLFYTSLGVVTERGSILSHTAIVCRELGLPTVVGAKGIYSAVKDGDLIELDASQGVIRIL